ncbi:phosphomevalonate kinase [Fructobacillus sp. CRL 2054]|uniref:mevalonate kinase family protein n=1 Tax=Fructobacillus sp. CRL 2054 TaxID=2763007 RepID=UPI00237837AC|nr:phosphomevalonate kinase [Fructobacillus sp. CRL 2054]MDD9139279.1 phosphomevalonate kinase [Fructobacillus sp. CRL 2054]
MNKPLHITVPGKLFLAGEYAVTTPGQPAIIAAVDRGMTVDIHTNTTTNQIILESDQYEAPYQTNWDKVQAISTADLATGSWTFIRAALAVFHQAQQQLFSAGAKPLHTVTLSIRSTMKSKEGKLGLGSSAAVTVAIIKALHESLLADDNPTAVFKEAAFAHYLVQGSGSLGDIATATYNQSIFYQAPAWLAEKKDWQIADYDNLDWSKMDVTPLNWPSGWTFQIVASRQPASTRKALAKNTDLSELLPASKKAVEAAKLAIQDKDYDAFKKALEANQEALITTLPAGYQTEKLATFLSIIKRLNLAGKISGAGFGDNGFVVGDDEHCLLPVKTAARTAGLSVIDQD